MNRIKILDSTLRDGGYVNDWRFGENNIKKILNRLEESGIDIIECGFLSNDVGIDKNSSKFASIASISEILSSDMRNSDCVCMINFGKYDIEDIPICDSKSVTGIRVAFHKKDVKDALKFCENISDKGYKLYMQPMVSVNYSDTEFIELIKMANKIMPYAFYIVDSFGVMKKSDLMRLFHLVDHNLIKDVFVGFHSHNNIQLSYSNAQALVNLKTKRKLIIDASVFGMGRGAGNLNTELFVEYLNDINGGNYKIKPLLKIIDEVLNNIYKSNYWGYSLPHYISAKHNCHPNYATHLASKDTLTVEDISNILIMLDESKKSSFDKYHIEKLYLAYQTHKINDSVNIYELSEICVGKDIIVIAPGSSINESLNKIKSFEDKPNTIIVAVNFRPKKIAVDYIFISNIRRFEQLDSFAKDKLIVTSNVVGAKDARYNVNYMDLLVEHSSVTDNAGLMLLKLLLKFKVKSIKLAGYDGYAYDAYKNYADENLTFVKKKEIVDSLNEGMRKTLRDFTNQTNIEFLTSSKYINLEVK